MTTPTHFGTVLAHFTSRIHRSKNRQLSIPAAAQQQLGLERRADNHIILVSIRAAGQGRWNHHYFKLTHDNEFAIPTDVAHLSAGDEVEVKVHRIIEDAPVAASARGGAGVLRALVAQPRAGWREDGSARLDEYLREEG